MARRPEPWRQYAAGSEIGHFAALCKSHLIQSEDRWEGKPLVLELPDASWLALDERAQIVKQARLPNLPRGDEGSEPRCLLFVERDRGPSNALFIPDAEAHAPLGQVAGHTKRLSGVPVGAPEELDELSPLRCRAPGAVAKLG
jgi:hypothetical protein